MKQRFLFTIAVSLTLLLGSVLSAPAALAAEADDAEETTTEEETEETEPETLENGEPRLDSAACCVMDQKTGMILYEKNMDEQYYPASITKILTTLLFIEHVDSLDEVVTFTDECWKGVHPYSNTNIEMQAGEELTAEQCMYAMMLASANEVCNQVAIYTAGSVEAFADMMNERAAKLGCTGSHFVNPNGIHDDNHYVTAHDMALISREAMKNETFRKITRTPNYTIKSTNKRKEKIELSTMHMILQKTKVHDDACIGGKTGWTQEANETLVTFMDKNDITLVCVVLDNAKSTPHKDTLKAANYCYEKYTRASIDAAAPPPPETETAAPETEARETELVNITTNISDKQAGAKTNAASSFIDRAIGYLLNHVQILLPVLAGILVLLSLLLVWISRDSKRDKK